MSHQFIKPSTIRKYLNSKGKRISASVIVLIDDMVRLKLDEMVVTHNGGRKTVDVEVAAYCGIVKRGAKRFRPSDEGLGG
jgi:hypothetical protein